MGFLLALVVSAFSVGPVAAQFYGSLGGYACSQPVLYTQCQCPTFCGSYGSGYAANDGFPDYQTWSRRHGRRRHHKKKKFRFETLEELDSKEFPPPPSSTSAPRSSTHSWEDEDLWERKFVNPKSKTKTSEGISEEFPEISSAEIAAARSRMRGRGEEAESSPAVASLPATAARPSGGSGGGVGLGSGVGVGGVGVNTGLGIGAPGIGGLGGSGGLFGISSGVGVGVPGVGPIGISSGLGIGR
ncbi:hypothetical protein ANCCEY_10804 [Ancylostoma ceylanicum]|uniref:Uncharacterized protein n=2 Tax=Ancylostoma ceylanicum TaxID=53326 RepID=A0A0D6LDT7_9BILA|nr:hypothetical protein ANCCEY_10804 [Ancylostoma ceylanicum]EYC45035.1 hypothetical protein Y032_0441g1515 [Ancylostoma ceylanicum]